MSCASLDHHVGAEDRRDLPALAHGSGSPAPRRPSYVRSLISTKRGSKLRDIWCAFPAAIVASRPLEGNSRRDTAVDGFAALAMSVESRRKPNSG
jgi:hypothetical protein